MKDQVKEFTENLELLHDEYKWRMSAQIKSLLSFLYVMNDSNLDPIELDHMSKRITEQVKWFSPFRSYQKYLVSAYLITKYSHSEEQLNIVLSLFDQLREAGFSNNAYTIICALTLLDHQDRMDLERIKAIYKEMRNKHLFLTTQSDYPLATLLSFREQEIPTLIDDIEYYYQALSNQRFSKGNDLQFLSHILHLLNEGNREQMVERVIETSENFKRHEIKLRKTHYSMLGILSVVHLTDDDYEQMKDAIDYLNHYPHIRYNKLLNTTFAAMLLVLDKVEDKDLISTNLSTTLEMMIQAQQAAMVAAIVASSTAASSAAASSSN